MTSTENDPEDISELMLRIDEYLASPSGAIPKHDLDRVIAYQRKQRALREQGVKPRKAKSEVGELMTAAGLEELMKNLKASSQVLPGLKAEPPKGPVMKRRF